MNDLPGCASGRCRCRSAVCTTSGGPRCTSARPPPAVCTGRPRPAGGRRRYRADSPGAPVNCPSPRAPGRPGAAHPVLGPRAAPRPPVRPARGAADCTIVAYLSRPGRVGARLRSGGRVGCRRLSTLSVWRQESPIAVRGAELLLMSSPVRQPCAVRALRGAPDRLVMPLSAVCAYRLCHNIVPFSVCTMVTRFWIYSVTSPEYPCLSAGVRSVLCHITAPPAAPAQARVSHPSRASASLASGVWPGLVRGSRFHSPHRTRVTPPPRRSLRVEPAAPGSRSAASPERAAR